MGFGRDLEADAPYDEDVARLLEGCGGDPELIRKRVRAQNLGSQRPKFHAATQSLPVSSGPRECARD